MFHGFDLNRFVIQIATLLFAVTIHEVAHGWVAYRLGDPTAKWAGRLTLNPLKHLDPMGSVLLPLMLALMKSPFIFGYAKPVPVNFRNLKDHRRDTMLVAAAGVTANLLCAFVCGIAAQVLLKLGSFWAGSFLRIVVWDLFLILGYSVLINAVLAVFNLIPIPPLDGSRVLSMLLPRQYARWLARIERFGMLIIIFLLFTGVLNSILSFFLHPLLRILLGSQGLQVFFRYAM